MELALEEFQTNDGIHDDQEYDQEKDVEQWNHCRDDRVEDNLQTYRTIGGFISRPLGRFKDIF